MLITKEFTFDAAHKLPNYEGKCKNLHGHTYRLQVTLEGEVKDNGMIIDFCEIDKIVKEKVISILDHSYLNDTIDNPTAENIVLWIKNQLSSLKLKEIKLWETPTSFVTL